MQEFLKYVISKKKNSRRYDDLFSRKYFSKKKLLYLQIYSSYISFTYYSYPQININIFPNPFHMWF